VLDADERLIAGENLRNLLHHPGPTIELVRVEPDRRAWLAPSRLFRLTDFVRYSRRSYWLDYGPGSGVGGCPPGYVKLEHTEAPELHGVNIAPGFVYVEHRWDQRSPWRIDVQRRHGRALAELDHD